MDLKDIKQIWRENAFHPNKKLGQNFLVDKNVRDNIVSAMTLSKGDVVVEIGAGFGIMSFLIAERCRRLIAVEKDDRICRLMESYFGEAGNITLMHADILEVDLKALAKHHGRLTVFGNIPYYITTPVIEQVIENRGIVKNVYLVMQAEVADRIVSPPGSKKYGSLSCYVQFYTKPTRVFRIKKNSFFPKPLVESCLLKLEILDKPSVDVKDEKIFFGIIRKAFMGRRKQLVNSLASHADQGGFSMTKPEAEELLKSCGIPPLARAEDLSLSDYARLANAKKQ